MSKVFKDVDIKMEILIKLAFGYSYANVAKEYDYSISTIMNLRKNNYIIYNTLVDNFRIIDEVAELGLAPVPERAVNICKRFYGKKFIILNEFYYLFNNQKLNILGVIDLADQILAKDNISPLNTHSIVKNYYIIAKKKGAK